MMERFAKRCTAWPERFISRTAKETPVKSVVQVLPTYSMGMFKISMGFCEKYEELIRDFWWGDEGHRKTHCLSWENMTIQANIWDLLQLLSKGCRTHLHWK